MRRNGTPGKEKEEELRSFYLFNFNYFIFLKVPKSTRKKKKIYFISDRKGASLLRHCAWDLCWLNDMIGMK